MELRHIRYFLTVAEELNFTKAAEKLAMAQPPLSRQIQDLEAELGAKLFVRKPRALQLTEEGEVFRQYAVRVMELVDKSTEDVRELKKGLQGTLYLASVDGSAPHLLSGWIAGFHKSHPHIQYNLWNGNSDDVTNRIMKGFCDLAVIMEPYNAEGLHGLKVFEEPWVAIMPADHPLAKEPGDSVSLKKLVDYDLIIPSRQSRLQEIEGWFAGIGRVPNVRCRRAHVLNAYELTSQGLGIAIYPAASRSADLYSGVVRGLRAKRIVEPEVTASYVLIWSKSRPLSHAAREFLTYIRRSVDGR